MTTVAGDRIQTGLKRQQLKTRFSWQNKDTSKENTVLKQACTQGMSAATWVPSFYTPVRPRDAKGILCLEETWARD